MFTAWLRDETTEKKKSKKLNFIWAEHISFFTVSLKQSTPGAGEEQTFHRQCLLQSSPAQNQTGWSLPSAFELGLAFSVLHFEKLAYDGRKSLI